MSRYAMLFLLSSSGCGTNIYIARTAFNNIDWKYK